jgi:hypothetical protein
MSPEGFQVHPESALPSRSAPEPEYTGKSVSYYRVGVERPTAPDVQPYIAECNDIIEALGMTYAEGNAFKAIWRRCAARTLGKAKKGYTDGLYDAEKVEFFGARMVAIEKQLANKTKAPSAVHSDAKTTTHCDESAYKCASDTEHEWVLQNGTNDIFCRRCLAPYEKP